MAKPKLTDFKKFIAQMTSDEKQEELLKLFGKLPQVQEYYAQELMGPEDRKKILAEYKAKIYKQFWTRGDNPRIASNAEVRKIISDFENISVVPKEVVELLLYRVDIAFEQANDFGGAPDANYNSAITAYEKALKIITKEQLEPYFKKECLEISRQRRNMDYWPVEHMENLNEHYLGEM
jgi:hypothetical protein